MDAFEKFYHPDVVMRKTTLPHRGQSCQPGAGATMQAAIEQWHGAEVKESPLGGHQHGGMERGRYLPRAATVRR
ncbi:MAG: hypothetical protein IPN76_31325 [Saprospiraceae bacterium]|nr:hypothetical protein [Saprospiraceae bacterium]